MRTKAIGVLALAVLSLTRGAVAQELPVKVKGGHALGETAEQFFAEGREKDVLSACATGNFKVMTKDQRREAKKYCVEVTDARQKAMSGTRSEYKSGDLFDRRMDTFTFDGGKLVRVALVYSAPSAEVNYQGHTFEDIFAGVKEAYGPATTESTQQVQDAYGVPYTAHHDLWLAPTAAIRITEQPGPSGTTTLEALTRPEYDKMIAAGAPKPANPLE